MTLDRLRVSFNINKIHCSDEGDGSGNAEPFIWIVFFKVDGETCFVGDDLKLHGQATIVSSPGSHGNLPDDVDAGDTITIPAALGQWTTTMKPIRTPFAGKTVGGMIGMLAILLEEDSTSDHDIEVGHAALRTAVTKGINDLLKTLSIQKQDVTDEEIAALENKISSAVEKAVANEVDLFQGLWSYIGFGNGQDDKIGTAKVIRKHAKMGVGEEAVAWSWNNEGKWKMTGTIKTEKQAAVAVMRGGDWGSRFVFDRTTAQMRDENQKLFDDKGLRMVAMETWTDNGVQKWSTIHRSGTWAHRLVVGKERAAFLETTQTLFDDKGLRLENMATYVEGGVRKWAGSYRSGDWGHRLTVERSGDDFAKETQDFFDKKGLRLEQMITYVDGNTRKWAGIYRSGDWGHRFTMDRDTEQFLHETQTWFDKDGLRLIDVERYEVGGKPRWAAVYRTGNWAQAHIIDRGFESLLAEAQDAFDDHGLRLQCVDVYQLR